MIYFIFGAAITACILLWKDKLIPNSQANNKDAKQREIDELCNENNKLRGKNRDLQNQVEELVIQINKLKNSVKIKAEDSLDIEEELSDCKREISRLRQRNNDLQRQIDEYKTTCESYENQINALKN